LKAKKSAIEKDPQNTELKSHLYSEEAKVILIIIINRHFINIFNLVEMGQK
jgi:hypothetical protein